MDDLEEFYKYLFVTDQLHIFYGTNKEEEEQDLEEPLKRELSKDKKDKNK